ncbi:hypothetical protein [Falsirhodobacter halotolerans]|uniref:hypothetical protein n=1 Tax=Falsirhodobacter halotolerans TaxID=1146892 RepID=UPI001FD18E1C|nr:hypothetical protein [Falsirhodobacter halotolerans]MCJ8139591.1 hypothetical protein [Falsirhodobacter halotolerans]
MKSPQQYINARRLRDDRAQRAARVAHFASAWLLAALIILGGLVIARSALAGAVGVDATLVQAEQMRGM